MRYFYPLGAHSSGLLGDDPKFSGNRILNDIFKAAKGELPFVNIYGDKYKTEDGTYERDYIHVTDIAKAHVATLRQMDIPPTQGYNIFNVGSGKTVTELDLVIAFERLTGKDIKTKIHPKKENIKFNEKHEEQKAFTSTIHSLTGWKA